MNGNDIFSNKVISHRFIEANNIKMHIAEQGSGPLIIFCHGFPEFWYSWRSQMAALAEAGYHVVAPDQRGYGQTDRPEAIESYSMLHLVGDMVGLLDELGTQQAVIIGHDWGATVAWHAALLRPDRFCAVGALSVPYIARGPLTGPTSTIKPTDSMRKRVGNYFFYQLYFQTPGVAEAELEKDVSATVHNTFYSLSGEASPDEKWRPIQADPQASMFSAQHSHTRVPSWITEEELDLYTETFTQTGYRGGLNWYRNLDRNWELLAAYSNAPISQPALFIWGDQDPVLEIPGVQHVITTMEEAIPHLESVPIPGSGHWIQQEKAAEVNAALLSFIQRLELK